MSVLNSGKVKSKLGFNVKALTSANIPSAAQYNCQIIYLSDIGVAGSYWMSNGSYWCPVGGEVTLAQSGVAVSLTGTTSETVLATYTLPAKIFGSNANIETVTLWSFTSSADNKQMRIRSGNISGTIYYFQQTTTNASSQGFSRINANNSTSEQKGWGTGVANASGFGSNASAIVTSSLDTVTTSNDILITGQLANSGETLSLMGYTMILRG